MKSILFGLCVAAFAVIGYLMYVNSGESVRIIAPPLSDSRPPLIGSANTRHVIDLIALSAEDSRAVVSIDQGSERVIAVGQVLDPTSFKLIQVSSKKIVLRDVGSGDMVFVYLQDESGKSRTQTLSNAVSVPSIEFQSAVLAEKTR